MKTLRISLFTLLMCVTSALLAQQVMWMKSKHPIVCYGKEVPGTSHVPMSPDVIQKFEAGRSQQTKTANFIVTYNGFSTEARDAFQKAVDIWESILISPVDIHVTANWSSLGAGVLGSATAGTFYANFDGAQQINTWYPVALAEKMAGHDLNPVEDIDIFAQFNSNNNSWYYGLDGATPAGQYDLVTVVLHELGHGLGFLDSYNISNGIASVGLASTGIPVIYDLALENGIGQNLFISTESESTNLKDQLTSNNLFYNSPRVASANSNSPAKVYAPSTFSSGSSIAHLDENTFAAGNANALMTPQIGTGESNFDPGSIVKEMFSDMGWVFTRLQHQRLPNVENTDGPFIVKVTITSDAGSITSPQLIYNTGGSDITVDMQPTANANEYEATIPGTGTATTYAYYISVKDNLNRTYTKPGKQTVPVTGVLQSYFSFETGEDTKAPIVNHTAPGFILAADTSLVVDAYITDNIGLASATVEYSIDNVDQPAIEFELQDPPQDSIYRALIDLGEGLTVGSTIRYKIVVVDNSSNSNQLTLPAANFYEVSVEGLGEAVSSYENTFNVPSSDFFGNGFSITTVSGFDNPAIHSEHPYTNGDGFPDNKRNLIYQLKVPVKVRAVDAFILFDEVALVEPGEPGVPFGQDNFFDYVVVEGSKDGGTTWIPFANGYDARAHAEWLTRFNSETDANQNSTAVADALLLKSRQINMLTEFNEGDEVAIRFRLYIDQLANGWGWVIDNLKIQTDITAPVVLHNHVDYIKEGETLPTLRVLARDAGGIETLSLTYSKNNETEQTLIADDSLDYTFTLPIALTEGEIVRYKISATDPSGNETILPANGYFSISSITVSAPVSSYSNNFNSETTDFVGNFFDFNRPAGFSSDVLSSPHPYPNGFGLDSTSNLSTTLIHPITLGAGNTLLRFDEIAIVQNQGLSILFGTEEFNDYVIVEGSKDGGTTWLPFSDGYDATSQPTWIAAFTSGTISPGQSLFRSRLIDLLQSGNFETNDEVLIRFRLFVNATSNGWGWAIDNLYIQDPITGLESSSFVELSVHPNPSRDNVVVQARLQSNTKLGLQILDTNGRSVYTESIAPPSGILQYAIDMLPFPSGLYLLKVTDGTKTEIRKIVKID